MFWFFKSPVINVDCFCSDEIVFNNFRPDRANKFMPDFYKRLPITYDKQAIPNSNTKLTTTSSTLKKCNGFTDLFSQGFIIPSWADFQIEMLTNGNYYYSNLIDAPVNTTISSHPRAQYGDVYKNCGHVKLESPWLLKEKTGVKFTWISPAWHNTDNLQNFYILPGVVDFKLQQGTHVNAFQKDNSIVKFRAGDPLAHLIPISDKKLKLTHHLLSKQEFERMFNLQQISARYMNPRDLKAKCPL